MGVKKSIKKFMSEPAEMRLSEVTRVLEYFGFLHMRTTGSHYIFDNFRNDIIVIPVHGNKVTRNYIRYAKDIITKL